MALCKVILLDFFNFYIHIIKNMTFQNWFCFHLWVDALGRRLYSLGPLVEVPSYSVTSQILVRNSATNFKDRGYDNVLCDQGGSSGGCVTIRGKVKTHRERPAPLPSCLPQISYEVIQDLL